MESWKQQASIIEDEKRELVKKFKTKEQEKDDIPGKPAKINPLQNNSRRRRDDVNRNENGETSDENEDNQNPQCDVKI